MPNFSEFTMPLHERRHDFNLEEVFPKRLDTFRNWNYQIYIEWTAEVHRCKYMMDDIDLPRVFGRSVKDMVNKIDKAKQEIVYAKKP